MKIAIAILIAATAIPTMAADGIVSRPKTYTDVISCRNIGDSAERLKCFDTASAALEQATEARTIVILDQTEVKKAKKGLFGFSLPSVPFFNNDDDDDEFKQIEGVLASVQSLGNSKYQFSVKDAGTWQTTESSWSILRDGQKMKIKRGVAGSYMLSTGSGGVRVKRIN